MECIKSVPGAHVTTIVLLLLANLKLRWYWWQTESILILRAHSQIHVLSDMLTSISCSVYFLQLWHGTCHGSIEIRGSSMPRPPLLHHQGLHLCPKLRQNSFSFPITSNFSVQRTFWLMEIPFITYVPFVSRPQPETNVFEKVLTGLFQSELSHHLSYPKKNRKPSWQSWLNTQGQTVRSPTRLWKKIKSATNDI